MVTLAVYADSVVRGAGKEVMSLQRTLRAELALMRAVRFDMLQREALEALRDFDVGIECQVVRRDSTAEGFDSFLYYAFSFFRRGEAYFENPRVRYFVNRAWHVHCTKNFFLNFSLAPVNDRAIYSIRFDSALGSGNR